MRIVSPVHHGVQYHGETMHESSAHFESIWHDRSGNSWVVEFDAKCRMIMANVNKTGREHDRLNLKFCHLTFRVTSLIYIRSLDTQVMIVDFPVNASPYFVHVYNWHNDNQR